MMLQCSYLHCEHECDGEVVDRWSCTAEAGGGVAASSRPDLQINSTLSIQTKPPSPAVQTNPLSPSVFCPLLFKPNLCLLLYPSVQSKPCPLLSPSVQIYITTSLFLSTPNCCLLLSKLKLCRLYILYLCILLFPPVFCHLLLFSV